MCIERHFKDVSFPQIDQQIVQPHVIFFVELVKLILKFYKNEKSTNQGTLEEPGGKICFTRNQKVFKYLTI